MEEEMIGVNEALCTGCATCVPICPEEALECRGKAHVNDRCTECLVCVDYCPLDALGKGERKKRVERSPLSGPKVDVLIIGSGMGGMCGAALLAHAGYRVLIVEKLPRIGGRCSTIKYKGVKCTTGVIAPEVGGVVEELFRKVGADYPVRPGPPPHYLIKGKTMEVPRKGGLRALLTAAAEDQREVDKVLSAFSRAMGWMEPSKAISLQEWLLQYTKDEGILGLFQAMISATLLAELKDLPAQEYFLCLKKLGGFGRFGFCPQGSIGLPNSLLRVFRQHGGELWTRSAVKQVLVENGKACGAVVEQADGEIEVRAQAVISNVGPQKTVDLAGREHFEKSYLKELSQAGKPAVIISLQFVIDRPLFEQACLMVAGAKRVNALFQPTMICPELAPPGKHLLYVGAAPASLGSAEISEKEIDLCFEDLNHLLPGFEKHAEVLLISTFHGGWPGFHCSLGYVMPPKTPVMNLYNVGDSVAPPGTSALPATVLSAQEVVDDIKGRLHPTP